MVVKMDSTEDTAIDSQQLTLTDSAVARVRDLLQERQAEAYSLRVFISGGGCSGFQYGMALENNPLETDIHYEFGGVPVVVDPQSMGYLVGATIDYEDDLMGGGFKIENPNAVSTCGCGHSFKTSSEGGEQAQAHGDGCGCH